jgi:acid phosphatase family membrane protein YuiD
VAALAKVFVEVAPQTDRFEPDLKRKLARVDGSRAGISIGQSLGGGMRVGVFKSIPGIAKGLIAGFAALKGIQVFGGFIADAQESARVGRLTTQVIRSTGGAARVTADQVGNLATAISNKTGADDEAVQSGENLLLTFTGVRNAVGKGNDIFNQASRSIVDMTAALNNGQVTTEGIKSSSIQLGKALNSPIKGVTALQKVGVSFTESQRDQIKTLVESGHTLDAQKIILKELGKEFGGAAEAAADPVTKLKTVLGNLGEDVGTLVLPVV